MHVIIAEYDISSALEIHKIKYIEDKKLHYTLLGNTTIAELETLECIFQARFYYSPETLDTRITVRVPFEMWMIAVDLTIQKMTGLTSMDLPDYCWRTEYYGQSTPDEAASIFLEDLEFGTW